MRINKISFGQQTITTNKTTSAPVKTNQVKDGNDSVELSKDRETLKQELKQEIFDEQNKKAKKNRKRNIAILSSLLLGALILHSANEAIRAVKDAPALSFGGKM